MAVVAESVSHHLYEASDFDVEHHRHRSTSRATSTRSGKSTPQPDRIHESHHTTMSENALRRHSHHGTPVLSMTPTEQERSGSNASGAHSRQASTPTKGTKRAIEMVKSTDDMDATPSKATGVIGQSQSPSPSPSPTLQEPTAPPTPQIIKIRDLKHIQSLVHEDPSRRQQMTPGMKKDANIQYEISSMPIENIIEMVAGLLTKITSTNDMQHEHLHRQMPSSDTSGSISSQTSSVLAFHGKNVPSITILSYLNRINKYCPTSYEVFLSLLVYFDRMTEKVNAGPMQTLKEQNVYMAQRDSSRQSPRIHTGAQKDGDHAASAQGQTMTPPASGSMDGQEQQGPVPGTPHSRYQESPPFTNARPSLDLDLNLSHFFVVDSFNIHRLVIAGVTCASKFFSDIFYTNSRYAKVGGLPLPELNHLELQFLLLNDFRLSVPVEELQAYGTMLVEFYAREAFDPTTGNVASSVAGAE